MRHYFYLLNKHPVMSRVNEASREEGEKSASGDSAAVHIWSQFIFLIHTWRPITVLSPYVRGMLVTLAHLFFHINKLAASFFSKKREKLKFKNKDE